MSEEILVKQHHENSGIFQMNSPAIHSQYFQSSDWPSNVDCSNTNRVLCSIPVMSADKFSSGSFTYRFAVRSLVFSTTRS